MTSRLSHTATTGAAAVGFDLRAAVEGCTFDDVLFSPKFGILERRDPSRMDLSCPLTARITLARPFLSANMDTVTRAPMAILLAEEGGIGVIDRGFRQGNIAPQIREVEIVKRTQHGIIPDPYTIAQSATLAEAVAIMRGSHVGTLVVVDGQRRLRGLLTERDARFVSGSDVRVPERMTPLDALVVRTGPISLDAAEQVMVERKIKKLPLVDDDGVLMGLVTAKDILKQRRLPFATRDAQGRLRVVAAIGATGDYLERAVELDRAGADVLVIDIAHGHSVVMERALTAVRQRLGDAQLIAGNVATGEGARFLADRGANGVKVGIGPGGGCTTRMTTSFGVPQLQALVDCGEALAGRVPAIADGGITRDGSVGHGAAPRRRYRHARERLRRDAGNPGRGRPQVGATPRVAKAGQGAVQGAPRDGIDRRDQGSPRRRGCGRGRSASAWRRRPRGERAGARLRPPDHPGHDEAPLLVDQLRRGGQPRGA